MICVHIRLWNMSRHWAKREKVGSNVNVNLVENDESKNEKKHTDLNDVVKKKILFRSGKTNDQIDGMIRKKKDIQEEEKSLVGEGIKNGAKKIQN